MINTIDPGTSKGSALASSREHDKQIVTLAFLVRDDERGTISVPKHWGAPIEYGPTLYERPRVHQRMVMLKGSFIIASANDLIQLDSHGMHAACFVAGPHPVRCVEPQVWKKQVAKCMHHQQALKHLSYPELALIAGAYKNTITGSFTEAIAALETYISDARASFGKTHKLTGYTAQVVDLLDAVCLNLWETGRFRV